MEIRISFFFVLFISLSFGQTRIYKGNSTFMSDQLYEINNEKVYRVQNPANKVDFLYLEQGKVYLKERKFFLMFYIRLSQEKSSRVTLLRRLIYFIILKMGR
jgi:hypothetical protein